VTCRYRHVGNGWVLAACVAGGWCTLTLSLFLPCESLAWGGEWGRLESSATPALLLLWREKPWRPGGGGMTLNLLKKRQHPATKSPPRAAANIRCRREWGGCIRIRVTRAWRDEWELNSFGGNANRRYAR
jgi:hypothetical protein